MSYIRNNVAKNNKIKQAYIFVDCFFLYGICNFALVMWCRHNDDGICKITSPLFCFLDGFASERSNFIHQITSKRYRCPDVIFITEVKSTTLQAARGRFKVILGYELVSLLKTLLWLWSKNAVPYSLIYI